MFNNRAKLLNINRLDVASNQCYFCCNGKLHDGVYQTRKVENQMKDRMSQMVRVLVTIVALCAGNAKAALILYTPTSIAGSTAYPGFSVTDLIDGAVTEADIGTGNNMGAQYAAYGDIGDTDPTVAMDFGDPVRSPPWCTPSDQGTLWTALTFGSTVRLLPRAFRRPFRVSAPTSP